MSASAREIRDVKAACQEWTTKAAQLGHHLVWKLGENATKAGYGYFRVGTCTRCAAEITVGLTWTSCGTLRDARKLPCPGMTDLTLPEQHASRQVDKAITQFVGELDRLGLTAQAGVQADAGAPVVTLTRHTCNDGRGPHFGRKTPGCPRCDELAAGAATRAPAWGDALKRRQENDALDRRYHAQHFAPGGPHATGACGPVCTFGDW
jgi:hypothetical protein